MGARTSVDEKVRLLLAKAESTTPAEAEALTAAAEKLMLRHGIDLAMLQASGQEPQEEIVLRIVDCIGLHREGYAAVLTAVAFALGAQVVVVKLEKSWQMRFVAHESDADLIETLYASLRIQSETAMKAFWRDHPYRGLISGPAQFREKRTFLYGFASGVSARLKVSRGEQAAASETVGAELVLVDRARAVEDQTAIFFPRLRAGRHLSKNGSVSASRSGHAAGLEADTGDRRVSGRLAVGS